MSLVILSSKAVASFQTFPTRNTGDAVRLGLQDTKSGKHLQRVKGTYSGRVGQRVRCSPRFAKQYPYPSCFESAPFDQAHIGDTCYRGQHIQQGSLRRTAVTRSRPCDEPQVQPT
jgi:hypothetical protein